MLFLSSRTSNEMSLRRRMYWAAPILLAPLVVPLLAFLATEPIKGKSAWTVCALSDLMSQDECIPSVRWLIVGLSLVPTFGLLMLIWWRLCALTEIKWLFERPWSGLGDDVSHANASEGLARAAIVILIIVACLAPICYSLLAGISATGAAFGYVPHPAKAEPACRDGDQCNSKTGPGTNPDANSGRISKAPPEPPRDGQPSPGQHSSDPGGHSPGNLDSDTIRDIAAILRSTDANSALGAIGAAVGGVNNSLRSQGVSGSLGEIRRALEDISTKGDASTKAVGALRQSLLGIDQTLQSTKDAAVLESIRASLQKIADAPPTAGSSIRLPEVEQSLDRINATLTGKVVPAVDMLKQIHRALEDVSTKGNPSEELSDLRKSLADVEQALRKLNDPAALESFRATLQKIADAMPAGQPSTRLAEVEKSLDRISDTLANKVAPAMDGMGKSLAQIDSTLGKEKPGSACFEAKFMARPALGSALMQVRGESSGQRFRPVKSHYLTFDFKHADIPEDEQQQIVSFLSDGAASAALSIRGFADGDAGKTNEGYASKRALAVAEIAARTRPDRKIVDLQWSVGGERSATVRLVEECR